MMMQDLCLLLKELQVYAAQPREGTETKYYKELIDNAKSTGLCSSTPRGDGNDC